MESERKTIKLKELLDLAKENKLTDYVDHNTGVNIVHFIAPDIKPYEADITNKEIQKGFSFVLFLNKEGIYEIVDGRKRINYILDNVKSLSLDKLKEMEDVSIEVEIIKGAVRVELEELFRSINSGLSVNESNSRYWNIHPQMKIWLDLYSNMTYLPEHCLLHGNNYRNVRRDFIEILIAFCSCKDFRDADKVTSPSGLSEVLKKKPFDINKDNFHILIQKTISIIKAIFKNTSYVLKAVDFCYMAIFSYCIDEADDFSGFEDEDYPYFFYAYIRMWSELEPCITLNPLSYDSIEKVKSYFLNIISTYYYNKNNKDEIYDE
jgi:hypothetical protein